MPPRTIDFWFDYTCPYAYLASTQVEALARRTGATLAWKPMLLGGVFRAVSTPQKLFATLSPPKAHHNALDLDRQAELFGVTLVMPAGHPFRSVEALRATLATGCDPRVIHGFYRAYWVAGREISAPDVMRDVLANAGYDPETVLAKISDEALKDDLRRRTDEAIALGIFGAPAFVVDGARLYWGQDRMHFVEGLRYNPDASPPPRDTPMAHTLEIYWDFSSPFSYLGATQAEAVAARTGANLVWRPMLLGGVFKAIGQVTVPMQTWSAAKQQYTLKDMTDWATYWDVPFKFPSRFPTNSLKAMRAYLALPEERRKDYRERVYRAYWAEDRDIADDSVLSEIIGADAVEVLARAQSPEVKQSLIDATQRAVEAGVFGAPTWVIDGRDLYWGQDRLALVERALTRGARE